jgi:molecular chaperone GrpE
MSSKDKSNDKRDNNEGSDAAASGSPVGDDSATATPVGGEADAGLDAEPTLEAQAEEADAADANTELSPEDTALLDQAATDLVAEMRSDMLRAQAELVNFRTRVERDRAANREAVIAEVIRALLPALDDLVRAQKHGDLDGSPLEIVATKIQATFDRYGLRAVGEVGEAFDPNLHEAVVQLPTAGVTVNTVADVIDPGYALGERLIRAAKVAVSVPE